MTGKAEQKSRKEKRKEARSEKQKLRFLSWVQHQGGKNKKPAMPSVESSPVEEKKPKKEPTAVTKRKREREERRKPKSKFQEYLEMEMGGAVSREEDLETEKRLAKMLKVKKGKLGGPDDGMDSLFADLGFGGDFGSDDETKEYDWKVADDTKLDKKKRKRKNKKVKNDAMEEPDDGGMEMAEENDGELHESEDREPNVIELPTESKARYVPPSLRATSKSESEEISQMRRRVRGLLNRLSESNVESITQEIAALFRSVPRSAGCQIIGDEVLASCSRGPRGNEQYAAVFAAFVAGMACLVGMDFSAKILASLAKSFEDEYSKEDGLSLRNLTLLFCYLCIFDVVSSDLVYDLLSVLSKRLTELDVSTVLTILQCCGMKLRGDDPGAMKDFILGIQNSVNQLKSHSAGQEDGKAEIHSKRMEFMLDTICDIKNNKKRPKEDPSHHTRIKKWLQKLKAEDVLLRGIKWSKLLDPEKKGQWWLSGDVSSTVGNIEDVAAVISKDVVEAQKLVQLSAAQRMNTDLRRAIFCIIMSAEDYVDAFEKLLRLDLSGKQDREIIRVIVDCCLQEKVFNKYYTVLASKLCSHDKNHKFSLQLSEVMARRGMNPTVSDQAIRLDLVAKSRGIAAAEKYFLDLPETSKTHLTYGALLNCYCKELMIEKAEALMEKMKELNFAFTAMSYNSLMTLYTKVNQPEKVPSIIQDMKADDVLPDIYTYNVWMRALAARKDIPGVERVIEEMKRDGRVVPDWTTYSNLASIYVDAGLFEKAESALKELEKRNTSNDLEAYQFLITLYGRTQNLVEVHRVWRSLKRNNPRMANMSYLNMIQVLANLKDLPAAEACFKEWEARHIHPPKTNTKDTGTTKTSTLEPESSTDASNNESDVKGTKAKGMEELKLKHPKYDIRVANAMIKAYITEGMIDKAVALKKRAKMRGGRLNAKTWEIFMEHYLKAGDLKMVHWCADRAIKKGHSSGRIWVPPRDVTETLMRYFEKNKDVDGAEKFVEALKKVQKDLDAVVFEPLVRTYAAAGKKLPGMRHRLKIENVEVSEETAKLLDSICVDQ